MSRIRKLKKPIRTAEEQKEEKKKLSKNQIFPIAVGLIMVLSVMGYMWANPSEVLKYGKYSFTKGDNGWYNSNFKITLQYHPLEVDYLNLSNDFVQSVLRSPLIYTTYISNDTYNQDIASTIYQLATFMANKGVYVIPGLIDAKTSKYNISEINCKNATASTPVLVFETGDMFNITENPKNCFDIQIGEGIELEKLADNIIYREFGIIKS